MENDTTIKRNNTIVLYADDANNDFERANAKLLNTMSCSSVNIRCFKRNGKRTEEYSLEKFLNDILNLRSKWHFILTRAC